MLAKKKKPDSARPDLKDWQYISDYVTVFVQKTSKDQIINLQ